MPTKKGYRVAVPRLRVMSGKTERFLHRGQVLPEGVTVKDREALRQRGDVVELEAPPSDTSSAGTSTATAAPAAARTD